MKNLNTCKTINVFIIQYKIKKYKLTHLTNCSDKYSLHKYV